MAERGVASEHTSVRPLGHGRHRRRAIAGVSALYSSTPWWLRVAVIWVLSRVVTTLILLGFASQQPANAWTGAHPNYLTFAQLWDSVWYHIVAISGYPSVLPMTPDGHVGQNAWAFMPGYPFLVRGLMLFTGLPWEPLSVTVSFAFSFAAALMLYRLMHLILPAGTALFSVVLFCVAPLSPIMQVSYAESMQMFLLTLVLYLLMQRRYLSMVLVVAIMALTRPSALAFALTLAAHVVYRFAIRAKEPFPVRERILASGVAVFSGLAGLAWPAIAWLVTGSMTAYTDTELAWRAPYVGYRELVPFASWLQGASFWLPGPVGVVVLVVVVAGFFASLFLPAVRALGMSLRLWLASYALYLLAVFFPQSSTFRLLMPLFPLAGALAHPRSRVYRVALVVVSILGQAVWIYYCWWIDGYDWTPP